jgi:simple sugar transport system ATP-binding protein/ribose transport system ATP-binding protein
VTDPILELRGIEKRFAGVHALNNVDLTLGRQTVHALVGENGAGKSTLGKIIAGAIRPDGGGLHVEGRPVHYRAPREALADGIATIQQELALVPDMTVRDNVLLGVETMRYGVVTRREMRRRFDELNERSGFGLPGDAVVADLRLAERQKVEILRAISRNARVIVMDEPTAALSRDEAQKLHRIVRELREQGMTIVYVSHFLEEVLALADTITVLRNGEVVETLGVGDATVERLVLGMLGREMTLTFPDKQPPADGRPVVLRVDGLRREGVFEDISFTVRAGEIVGLAGLVGSGRSEIARALFGADRPDGGTVELDGRPYRPRSPGAALRAGLAFVPESRKDQGLFMLLSQRTNVSMPHLGRLMRAGWVQRRREARAVGSLLTQLGVTPANRAMPVTNLSGGNQQKVLLAKSLFGRPRVVVLDEPTRGVDVGAKRSIYEIVTGLAREGVGVLVISSELEEILGLAHRVLVLRRGRIADELHPERLSSEAVMHAAFGVDAVAAGATV